MLTRKILLAATILAGAILPLAAQTAAITPVELQKKLQTSGPGAVVGLRGLDLGSCPRLSMSQTFNGGKLILSDSPESPTNAGILCMDANLAATAPSAPNRIFVYHVNASSCGKLKFSVLIKNNGKSAATLTLHRSGIAGPGANYLFIGETALCRWLTNSAAAPRAVAPGQTVRLDTRFDSIIVAHDALVNGIWDYSITQPHAIIICALRPKDDPVAVGPTLGVLARDLHDRGTFGHCNKVCTTSAGVIVDPAQGVREFPIGGDGDIYVTGFDKSVYPPVAVINDGNYGVFYTIRMKTTSGSAFALLLSPQGGPWCGAVNSAPGLLPGGAFIIPSDGRAVSDSSSAAVAGEYSPGARKTVWLQFMPAGASSFPVYIMTVPFSGRDH